MPRKPIDVTDVDAQHPSVTEIGMTTLPDAREPAHPSNVCESCSRVIAPAATHFYEIGDRCTFMCAECAADRATVLRLQSAGLPYWRAVLFGLAAAGLGAAVWVFIVISTGLEIGIVASIIGWVVALGVRHGAGARRSTRLQVIAMAITAFTLVTAEYLIVRHAVIEYAAAEYATSRLAFVPFELILEIQFELLKSSPVSLAFWAIAMISAVQA